MNGIERLKALDLVSESRHLSPEEWMERYKIEKEVEAIYAMEAIYWQQ